MVKVTIFGGSYCMNCKLPLKPSKPEGFTDTAMRVLGFHPVRCHRCCDRLYRRKNEAVRKRRRSKQKDAE